MKYYYDFEFLEGKQDKRFLGIKYGETKPTIDVISVGMVSEDNREYYAISKDFNLYEAWNRYDLKHITGSGDANNLPPTKVYWIRENVLKPIYNELFIKWCEDNNSLTGDEFVYFNYTNFKKLINKYGKTNKQIAEDIKEFIFPKYANYDMSNKLNYSPSKIVLKNNYWIDNKHLNPEFYGYYSDYDHVALCWLFGKMIDLPNGFPLYTIDLKQESDRIYQLKKEGYIKNGGKNFINSLSNHLNYPKQTNEHHSLKDAHFNFNLYKFLKSV